MDTVRYSPLFEESASRIELIVRFVWAVPLGIGLFFLGLLSEYILIPANLLLALLLGKRFEGLAKFIHNFVLTHSFNSFSYLFLLTDERAPILPTQMATTRFDYVFNEPASRLEVLIRILYLIPMFIVSGILLLIFEFAYALQWLIILVTGRRNKAIWDYESLTLRYNLELAYYGTGLTDERPAIIPQ